MKSFLCVWLFYTKESQVGIILAHPLLSKPQIKYPTAVGDAQSILLGLLSSIPSFWGTAELEQVVILYLDHCETMSSSSSALMSSLMKSVAKRAPAKALLPAMIELWPSLKTSRQMVQLTFFVFCTFISTTYTGSSCRVS